MNYLLRACVFLLLLLSFSLPATANHIFGADFSYSNVSGNNYNIRLVIYADCAAAYTGGNSAYSSLPTSQPEINIYKNGTLSNTINLSITGDVNGVEITPVCSSDISTSSCHSANGTLPGVKKFTYQGTTTLAGAAQWVFRFTGTMGPGSSAGRSTSLTNISAASGSTIMVLEATLNTAVSNTNSSPQFTGLATPFYCINVPHQYNLGAVDPNNDSLSFALVSALDLNATPVTYVNGLNAGHPIQAANGTFSFSSINGQLAFTPDQVQRSVVDVRETEYRNGVAIGSAMREMTFVVLGNCNTQPASADIDVPSVTGGALDNTAGADVVNTCAGSTVAFTIHPHDTAGTIYTTITGLNNGQTATVSNDSTANPVIQFNWNTGTVPAGTYTFFASYTDNACPLSNQQTQAYTVRVVAPPVIAAAQAGPTECFHKAPVHYQASLGLLPRTITVSQNGAIIHTLIDSTGSIMDSLAVGSYTIDVSSASVTCGGQTSLVIVDSGGYPVPPVTASPVQYCTGDAAMQLIAQPGTDATVQWYDAAHNALPAAPTPNTATPGNTIFYVNQRAGACPSSLFDTVLVQVTNKPTATFIATPSSVCALSPITLQYTGTTTNIANVVFNWQTGNADSVVGTDSGPLLVTWDTAGLKTVTLQVTENGCASASYQQQVLVKPTPLALFTVGNACQYDMAAITYDAIPLDNQQYAWSFGAANIPTSTDGGPIGISYAQAGIDTITLITSLNGCADTLSKSIQIYPKPQVETPIKGDTACFGDVVYLSATGADTYQWLPADKIYTAPVTGELYTRVTEPTIYTIIGTTIHGCVDTATITYSNVIACCTFSFPNAFTPNGDGRNDGYSPVIYGNLLWYNFRIYNRWGQCVFHSQDPSQKWNGTVDGKPCDIDTYYYNMKAKCLTGKEQEQTGDFILIR